MTRTKYAGNLVYKEGRLEFMNTSEGYMEPDIVVTRDGDRVFVGRKYVYQFKDHLGNIRLSYADSNDDGQINSIGFEVNLGVRIGADVHIDVPDDYIPKKRDPLMTICFVEGTRVTMSDG